MNDRALIPGQHVIRLSRLMLCADCAVAFDGSIWFGCPSCGTEVGIMAHPLSRTGCTEENKGEGLPPLPA